MTARPGFQLHHLTRKAPHDAPTVAASIAQLLLDMTCQGDPDRMKALCRAEGIDPALLADPDGRLPRADVDRLAQHLTRQASDPRLGFQALALSHPSVFQVVGFAMMGCPSLLEAMRCLARYTPILDESAQARVTREGDAYRLVVDSAAHPPPLVLDAGLAALLGFCLFITGGQPLLVREAAFAYPEPADLSAHRALLGPARLRFGTRSAELLMDAAQLERPLTGAARALQALHRQIAALQLDAVRHGRLLGNQVRQHIAEQLDGSAPTLQSVAHAMHRSPRSLQRALSMEGSSFKTLLDDTRRGLAHLYLHHSQRPLKEISYQLGFRELSSFYRACTRWFGQTPLHYRHAQGKPAAVKAVR